MCTAYEDAVQIAAFLNLFFIFRSQDDETAEAHLKRFYDFSQCRISSGIEGNANKSGNYCHTGNIDVTTLKFSIWEEEGESAVVVLVIVGGSMRVAEVQDHL